MMVCPASSLIFSIPSRRPGLCGRVVSDIGCKAQPLEEGCATFDARDEPEENAYQRRLDLRTR